jgi:hypothetical protein
VVLVPLSALELIGNLVVSLLLRVVIGDLINETTITPFLTRGKQEASRVFPLLLFVIRVQVLPKAFYTGSLEFFIC